MLSPSDERKFGDVDFDDIKKKLGNKVLSSSDPNTTTGNSFYADGQKLLAQLGKPSP